MRRPSLIVLFTLATACTQTKADDCSGDGVELVDGECDPVPGGDTGASEEDDGGTGADGGDGGSGDGGSGDGGSGDGGSGDGGSGDAGGGSGSGDSGTGDSGSDGDDGGGSDDGDGGDTELDVEGYYSDLGDYSYDIRTDTITVSLSGPGSAPMLYHVSFIDNARHFVSAENDAGNWTEGGNWSRFDWHEGGGADLYLCHTTTSAAAESDALSTPPATSSDLSNGCKGYAWTALTRLTD